MTYNTATRCAPQLLSHRSQRPGEQNLRRAPHAGHTTAHTSHSSSCSFTHPTTNPTPTPARDVSLARPPNITGPTVRRRDRYLRGPYAHSATRPSTLPPAPRSAAPPAPCVSPHPLHAPPTPTYSLSRTRHHAARTQAPGGSCCHPAPPKAPLAPCALRGKPRCHQRPHRPTSACTSPHWVFLARGC